MMQVEIPEDGWFHDHFMSKIFTKEVTEVMKYPLKSKTKF